MTSMLSALHRCRVTESNRQVFYGEPNRLNADREGKRLKPGKIVRSAFCHMTEPYALFNLKKPMCECGHEDISFLGRKASRLSSCPTAFSNIAQLMDDFTIGICVTHQAKL